MKTFNICSLALISTLYGTGISANDLGAILGGSSDHFKRPCQVSPSACPRITAPTPDYRSEWWYLTGNLKDEQGRGYGMQWTLFRQGIEQEIKSDNPGSHPSSGWPSSPSRDVSKGSHQQDERTSRQGRASPVPAAVSIG